MTASSAQNEETTVVLEAAGAPIVVLLSEGSAGGLVGGLVLTGVPASALEAATSLDALSTVREIPAY